MEPTQLSEGGKRHLLLWPQPGGNLVHGQHRAYTPTRWQDGSTPSSPLGTHTHVAKESGLPLRSFPRVRADWESFPYLTKRRLLCTPSPRRSQEAHMLAEHPSSPGHLLSLQVSVPLMTKKMRRVKDASVPISIP